VICDRQRPYHVENTGSRPITKVRQRWARLLGWVTALEHQVLLAARICFKAFLGFYFVEEFISAIPACQTMTICSIKKGKLFHTNFIFRVDISLIHEKINECEKVNLFFIEHEVLFFLIVFTRCDVVRTWSREYQLSSSSHSHSYSYSHSNSNSPDDSLFVVFNK
jgi:hypothetical protein